MSKINGHRIVTGISIGIILSLFMIASFYYSAPAELHILGVPVEDTKFSERVSSSVPLGYDMQGMLLDNGSIIINSTLLNQPMVSKALAIEAARDFVDINFEHINSSIFRATTPTLSTLEPAWDLYLFNSNTSLAISVNALSGKVNSLMEFYGILPQSNYFEDGRQVNDTIVESAALEFLKRNNITIPQGAYYTGIERHPQMDIHDSDYYLVFRNYAGSVRVSADPFIVPYDEGIVIIVGRTSGSVKGFWYRWHEIEPIPTAGLVSNLRAREIVMENNNYNNISIVWCNLTIIRLHNQFSPDGSPQWRLVWRVVLSTPFRFDVIIDARTGFIVEEWLYRGILHMPSLETPVYDFIPILILFASTIAIAIFISTNLYFTRRKQ